MRSVRDESPGLSDEFNCGPNPLEVNQSGNRDSKHANMCHELQQYGGRVSPVGLQSMERAVSALLVHSRKGQATLCVQSTQYRTRSSEIAFLRTVLVWLSTCIPYQLNTVSDYAITQYRTNASEIAHLVRIVCSGLYRDRACHYREQRDPFPRNISLPDIASREYFINTTSPDVCVSHSGNALPS